MLKKMLAGLVSSKRVWITVAAGVVLLASKFGANVPDGFADKFAELAMVLVASFGATGWGKEVSAPVADKLLPPSA